MGKNLKDLPGVLSAGDLADALGISSATAYNLLHRKDFPTLHIGKRLLVTRENLLAWMERHTNSVTAE